MSSASVVLVVEVENVLVGDDMELGVIDFVLTCTVDLLGYCLPSTLLRVGDIVAIIFCKASFAQGINGLGFTARLLSGKMR